MSNNNLPDWELGLPSDLPLKNSLLDAVHETALGLHRAGVIPDVTLSELDNLCLQPAQLCVKKPIAGCADRRI